MITVPGVITIKAHDGRNGLFCTGELVCSIGTFKVKESFLDQYEEGCYEGDFCIEKLSLSSRVWNGQVFTHIQAKLASMSLDTGVEQKVAEAVPDEPDPILEGKSVLPSAKPVHSVAKTVDTRRVEETEAVKQDAQPEQKATSASETPKATDPVKTVECVKTETVLPETIAVSDELIRLFGAELAKQMVCGGEVRLDPNQEDRSLFRQQRDKLKSEGYRFDFKSQVWVKG